MGKSCLCSFSLLSDGCETFSSLDMSVSWSCRGSIQQEPARGQRQRTRDLGEESRVAGAADLGVCVRAEGSELTCQKSLFIFSCVMGGGGGESMSGKNLLL